MFRIGCHLSSQKGFLAMGEQAVLIGANTFQFFTRNPRGGSVKPLDLEDIEKYNTFAKENDIKYILAHAPYTLNASAAKEYIRVFAKSTMLEDISRLEYIKGAMLNFHPGSHVGQGADVGIELISGMLNEVLTEEQQTVVLLETMAGKGSEIGGKFEELREIIDKTALNSKLGVCLDTCHIYDAGYDIINNLDEVLSEFDRIIGLSHLKAIHLNDSKNPFHSQKDRHEKIGEGSLGAMGIAEIINHPVLRDLPFYLETPNEIDGYAKEIALLKTMRK
ncbi:MAG: deoxyribonuclease IV [Clostridiales bacterium]|jgi:deoxyribonuclease-4|nr:deoxyribonuclease IV [Clostridiales bacterium]